MRLLRICLRMGFDMELADKFCEDLSQVGCAIACILSVWLCTAQGLPAWMMRGMGFGKRLPHDPCWRDVKSLQVTRHALLC